MRIVFCRDHALEQLALGKRKALVLFTGKMGGGKGFYFGDQG